MSNIILIGPILTGKSTLADILSQKLGYPRCSVDGMRWQYYEEIGFVEHQSNYKLAKHIIYTKDKTPEECAEEIISLVRCGTK
ncbi:hypothetical protein [Paenibacillus dendritiformis]|uniref:Shikimate kinase n=1 Tax=Paenibacillus dendritiformis C454 TaxID=1131935 RepID=H3SFS1_9BACL|nr:hypothetical protein [Paenibacillus dendritiformis]EHQ62103.1 shikimate kinase [Paenibacillus dendritiformis C454]CAH8772891.1 hypothetical protein H7S4_005638 [Paenibacillus dendritiformis]